MSEEGSYIDDVCNRIKFDKEKLENNELEQIEVDSFNVADFWIQFGASVQSLSNEVTKIGFMCGKKPYPNQTEVNGMMGDVIQYYTIMRDLYLVLPEEVGAVIYKAVTVAVLNIMVALIDIVHSLKDLSENGARERLALTGVFWDACNAVDSLPRNNLQATLQVLDEESALTKDAMEELTNRYEQDNTRTTLEPSSVSTQAVNSAATDELGVLSQEERSQSIASGSECLRKTQLGLSIPINNYCQWKCLNTQTNAHHSKPNLTSAISKSHDIIISSEDVSFASCNRTEAAPSVAFTKPDNTVQQLQTPPVTSSNQGVPASLSDKACKRKRGKRRTVRVRLGDGTLKRVNVRKLGLPYFP